MTNLAPLYWHRRGAAHDLGLIEHRVRSHMGRHGGQHLLFAINQIGGVEGRQLEAVSVGNCVGRAGLDAISAKNAAVVIDVVNLGVAFAAAHAFLGRIFGRFDIDAIAPGSWPRKENRRRIFPGRSRRAAERARRETAPEILRPATAPGHRDNSPPGRLEHLHEGDAHALGDSGYVLQYRHTLLL